MVLGSELNTKTNSHCTVLTIKIFDIFCRLHCIELYIVHSFNISVLLLETWDMLRSTRVWPLSGCWSSVRRVGETWWSKVTGPRRCWARAGIWWIVSPATSKGGTEESLNSPMPFLDQLDGDWAAECRYYCRMSSLYNVIIKRWLQNRLGDTCLLFMMEESEEENLELGGTGAGDRAVITIHDSDLILAVDLLEYQWNLNNNSQIFYG